MKRLLNTLYIMSKDVYLTLDGENVVAKCGERITARYPLHTLQSIIDFSYMGASPALLGKCADMGVAFTFCSPRGRFLARVTGEANGNVLLRRKQYRVADDEENSCLIAKNMIFGKLYNSKQSIERTRRDHALRVDCEALASVSQLTAGLLPLVQKETRLDGLRGLEGVAANAYFSIFNELILNSKELFRFTVRSRRPPLDAVNALLSLAYSTLALDCASALESVGLDSYVGFLHRDRPGRTSLALDLMEELRPCMADRFVLTCINNRMFDRNDFDFRESGAVLLKDDSRRRFYRAWQERKKDELKHPYLGEKLQWGMIPYVQALLLARYLRGDLDAYPPFLWK